MPPWGPGNIRPLLKDYYPPFLRIIEPSETGYFEAQNTPVIQVHSSFHWRVQGFLGIVPYRPWPKQTTCSQGTPLKLTQGDENFPTNIDESGRDERHRPLPTVFVLVTKRLP